MSHTHIRKECKHGFLYAQCRCPAENKPVVIVACDMVHDHTVPVVVRQNEHKNYDITGLSRGHISAILVGLEIHATRLEEYDYRDNDSGKLIESVNTLIDDLRTTFE